MTAPPETRDNLLVFLVPSMLCVHGSPPSLLQRVEHDVQPDPGGVFAGVAAAFQRIVLFQRATQVVGREDHAPVIAELDALQVGRDLADRGFQRAAARPVASGSRRDTVRRSNPP